MIAMPGARPGKAAPVDLGFFMDGELIHKSRWRRKSRIWSYFGPLFRRRISA